MRETFHPELNTLLLNTLIGDLARIARLGTDDDRHLDRVHHADLGLAESVVSGAGEMKALCDDINQRCVKLLVLQAPVPTDLRMVVAAMHAAGGLKRMCNLAQGAETAIVHQVSFLATGQPPER